VLFNSFAFAVFLPIIFALYWSLSAHRLRQQNALLLVASYVFYGWWDWRFLLLIVASSLVDFLVGMGLGREYSTAARKALLSLSIGTNLAILGFFKYFNFFVDSAADLLTQFGFHASPFTLQVILPVGISFYTFQTLSYSIDIYRRQLRPASDPVAFFAFVAFFPQLVAGPIERAKHLLPQFGTQRSFDPGKAADGARQILWGLFKKIVIADNLAPTVDTIFSNYSTLNSSTLALGVLYFAIQIYCDFSGYSDIAIGTARLFGFNLMRNFAFPYFSRDIGEFWRRWHISLSSWFRDYVYIPLGGSQATTRLRHIVNLMATFTISGLWHGASWTFVVWGLLNGLYYLPLVLMGATRNHMDTVAAGRLVPSLADVAKMLTTFCLTLFAWVFFRADSIPHAVGYLNRLLMGGWTGAPSYTAGLAFVCVILLIEWLQRERLHGLQIDVMPRGVRWAVYYGLIAAVFFLGNTGHVPFIYFQF
jgi:alginate O-acetyltransferase complex protein AlgI